MLCAFNLLLRNLKRIKRLYVKLKAQLFGLSDHIIDNTFFVFLFIIKGSGILIGSAIFPEVIENSCQFVGGGSNCFWGAQASTHTAIVAPKGA